MTLSSLLNQPATIINRHEADDPDEYGNKPWVEDDPVETTGYFEQTAATEVVVDRDTYTTDWLIVLPAAIVVSANARIEAIGRKFEVVGQVADLWNPRTRAISHKELRAVEVTG